MTRTSPRVPAVLAVLLALGVFAAIGVAVVAVAYPVTPSGGTDRWPDKRTDAVVRAARDCARALLTLSHTNLDATVRTVTDCATGQFREEFTNSLPNLRSSVTANRVEASCEVREAAVSTVDDDQVTVLVATDMTVRNTATPEGAVRHDRLELAMVEVDDRWLVSRLKYIS